MNNKINLPIAAAGIALLLTVVGAAQARPNGTANSTAKASQKRSAEAAGSCTHLVAALHSIADTIKACPRVIEFDASRDSQQSEGPLAHSRLYYGPPVNVTWGVSGNSIRPPYQGYVQFSVPREFWIPPDVRKRWGDEAADLYADLFQAMPLLEYRYKFGWGPAGLQLAGILVRTAEEIEWKDVPISENACSSAGCTPACWQSAASFRLSLHRGRHP